MPATYEPIATTTLGSAAASITFSSIPATFTDLRLVLVMATGGSNNVVRIKFNSDTGDNFSRTSLIGDGSTVTSTRATSASSGTISVAAGGSTQPALVTTDIFSYAGSTNKTWLSSTSTDLNGSGSVGSLVGLWRNTAAINNIELSGSAGNFATGTTATLYGIKNA